MVIWLTAFAPSFAVVFTYGVGGDFVAAACAAVIGLILAFVVMP